MILSDSFAIFYDFEWSVQKTISDLPFGSNFRKTTSNVSEASCFVIGDSTIYIVRITRFLVLQLS